MNDSRDSLQQLFKKLLAFHSQENALPYLFLIQHSLSSQLRQTATAAKVSGGAVDDDETIYRRAGLRTPAENASRDWEAGSLWLKELAIVLSKEARSVLWLRTSTRQLPTWLQQSSTASNIKVIDAASDPFGWDGAAINMDQLSTLIRAIEKETTSLNEYETKEGRPIPRTTPLIIESLTPILQRHGLNQAIRFLRKLLRLPVICPLVVPVLSETLSSAQHQQLEDLANAVLFLSGGEAVLLRQGVRERTNMIRENLSYRIVLDDQQGQRRVEHITEAQDRQQLEKEAEKMEHEKIIQPLNSPSLTPAATVVASGGERRKVQLEWEEEDTVRNYSTTEKSLSTAPPTTQGMPRIYMQDDDPEFEDYDDEDPDDDLDL